MILNHLIKFMIYFIIKLHFEFAMNNKGFGGVRNNFRALNKI